MNTTCCCCWPIWSRCPSYKVPQAKGVLLKSLCHLVSERRALCKKAGQQQHPNLIIHCVRGQYWVHSGRHDWQGRSLRGKVSSVFNVKSGLHSPVEFIVSGVAIASLVCAGESGVKWRCPNLLITTHMICNHDMRARESTRVRQMPSLGDTSRQTSDPHVQARVRYA